ncbi:MAG TPA: HU family DNA-binding protein [Thermodesulfovibrionales bacterium]|jgi:integration host factor beta subunit|nr:HU family DNA-binding protein [Thermodesulfovibrionales bacterium]
MTKSALIDKVAEKVEGLTRKQTEIIVDTVFDGIRDALAKGEKIEIRGFGNFRLKQRRPRRARNPKTGEGVDVPSKRVLHFKVGKALKDALNPQ